jgi:hypothetical protein
MNAGQWPTKFDGATRRANRPCSLLRLILRGMRQRAFVVFDPHQMPHIDPAVARLASEKMFGLGDGPPIGRSPSNDPRGLGSSICMTVVISTSQKIRPRNCFQGLIRTAGVHPPAPPSQFILSQQSPLSNRGSDLRIRSYYSPTPSGDRDLVSLLSKADLICAISARRSTTRNPCPIQHAIKCSGVVDHQRSIATHRRDERGTVRLPSSCALRGLAVIDRRLLRLILRRVRQRAFVILHPWSFIRRDSL